MQAPPISPERMTYPQILAQSRLVQCSARTNRRLAYFWRELVWWENSAIHVRRCQFVPTPARVVYVYR